MRYVPRRDDDDGGAAIALAFGLLLALGGLIGLALTAITRGYQLWAN